jgi:hypothetical protein
MKLLFAIPALIVAISGCFVRESQNDLVFHADTMFSPMERKCIEDSVDQWSEQTSGHVNIQLKWDWNSVNDSRLSKEYVLAQDHIVRWNSSMEEVKERDRKLPTGVQLLGECHSNVVDHLRDPVEIRIVGDRVQNENLCKLVTMHEVGHSLGLAHIDGWKADIMYPSADDRTSACLKDDDLAEWCLIADCDPKILKPCPGTVQDLLNFGPGKVGGQ